MSNIISKCNQKFPFIMVDKITKICSNGIEGIKNISANDFYYNIERNELPDFFGIEIGGQLVEFLLLSQTNEKQKYYLAAIKECSLIKKITIGKLCIRCNILNKFNKTVQSQINIFQNKINVFNATIIHSK